jgi:hypothetical protein
MERVPTLLFERIRRLSSPAMAHTLDRYWDFSSPFAYLALPGEPRAAFCDRIALVERALRR